RVPRDARRAGKARRRSRHLVGVDGASRVIALASRTFVSRTMRLQPQAGLQLRHRLVHPARRFIERVDGNGLDALARSVNAGSQLLYRYRHYSCPMRTIVPMVWPWTSRDL